MKNYLKPYLLTGVALLSVNGTKAIGYEKSQSGNRVIYQNEQEGYSFDLQSDREFVINRAGTYKFMGIVSNAKILISGDVSGSVNLILDDVTINSEDTIIYSESSHDIKLSLFNRNVLNSTGDRPVIKTHSTLTVNGIGSMFIKSIGGDGLDIQKDLTVEAGYLTIDTVNNGVTGIKKLTLLGGDTAIKAGNSTIRDEVEIVRNGGQLELFS